MKADVVTVGESMVLFQPMQEGSLAYVPLFTRTIAGAESNVAIALTRLGIKTRWISRVGKDPFGDAIISTLAGEGVDTSLVIRDGSAPTSVFFKEYKGYGDPNVYYYRQNSAASRLSVEDVSENWFKGARLLHVTGITPALGSNARDMVMKTMKLARKMGLVVSFDPNIRRKLWSETTARKTLLSLVPLCDIFLPGLEEAEFLLGARSIDDYGSCFLEMGAKVVALKLGTAGSKAFIQDAAVKADSYPADRVLDTVGAGDAFAAGFLSTLLDENAMLDEVTRLKDLLKPALERANLMGSLAVRYRGDWEGYPRLDEVRRIQAGSCQTTR